MPAAVSLDFVGAGHPGLRKRLVRVTRDAEDEFSGEQMGPVRFLPLVGEEGWS